MKFNNEYDINHFVSRTFERIRKEMDEENEKNN
jgi:hypothetical protein